MQITGTEAQAMFEAITSDEHRVDLTLPGGRKSPTAAQRACWATGLSDEELSERWCATHPPVDGDDRTPYEVWQAGFITTAEFYACVSQS